MVEKEKQKEKSIDWDELMNFLELRIPQLKETDSSKFPDIKDRLLSVIKKAVGNNGESEFPTEVIKGVIQYAPRAMEKTDGEPLVIDSRISRYPGQYDEESFQKIEKVINTIYLNLQEEVSKFVKNHGEEIRSILFEGGNIVFVCTHPSWYTLLFPTLILSQLDKSSLEESRVSLVTATGPLMIEKEFFGQKLNPKDVMVDMGINVLTTIPRKEEYEQDPEVLALGNSARKGFLRNFKDEREVMEKEGSRVVIIAPEATTTPISKTDEKYEIAPIDEVTEKVLKKSAEVPNTHFVVLGISEKDKTARETDPKDVEINSSVFSHKELLEISKNGLAETLRREMADLVDGRVEKS